MKRISCSTIVFAMLCAFASIVSAQPARILGGHMFQLDDGNGNTITIQTPNGGWLGNINYMLPQPPYPSGPSGWIAPGTLDGQIPVWNVLLNSWQPQLPSLALNVASNSEPFITFAPSASLTNNNILNAGAGISLVTSGAVPNASLTINNTGVLSAIAGAGISISGSTGNITFTNTGVGQILGTPNQVIVNNIGAVGQPGIIVLSTPQDIATNSSPTFAGLTITGLTPAGIVHNTIGGLLSSSAVDLASADVTGVLPVPNGGTGISIIPNNGQLLIGNGSGYTLSTITGTLDEINVTNAAGSIILSTPQPIAATSSPTFSALALTGKGTSASTVPGDVGTTLLTKDFVTTPGNVAVMTNASLIGDGTTGNSLGINLSNSNTWTADQLLPITSAQGDNLIAATNAGATTVNAVRIGNGLTDAQVNDNLTINGGSVTNSPVENSTIGAVTPNTGAFTTLGANSNVTFSALPNASIATDIVMSNAGGLETRTIASLGGMIAANTDATLTGNGTVGTPLGFNLSNSNTWTADQLLPITSAQGDNLIAATNAGATTVNAVRIGNGLTDAQVNDDLTINGGSVTNSPIENSTIGVVTPNSGAFTTLGANGTVTFSALPNASIATDIVMSNAGGLETRTIASLGGMIAANTDATLTGNGTVGTPLGFNLSNSNTWTADQLLPITSAQGDNLIAATNAGATTVNAVRIGNGLTDAQVNDNLTINGGSVTNSPVENSTIGAVTPNSGAFTTLGANGTVIFSALPNASIATDIVMSNGGSIETRTISSLNNAITVATNSSLIGDGTSGNPLGINLNNSNTFTADQLLPNTGSQGDNLIAAINACESVINAVNIGVGLSDAQVSDNLTINGGSVTNSPIENSTIGAVTPNTGAFTTLNATSLALTGQATSASTLGNEVGTTLVTLDYIQSPGNVPVIVNSPLTGNGTSGNPLDFNLNHTNVWSADQDLPATSTQGDNLIASINSSLSTINAANIGAGLSDAQVNDNLTINGGSVSNSPIENSTIGAITPSSGRFTAITGTALPSGSGSTEFVVSNGGALETRSLASISSLMWQVGGNAIAAPASLGSTTSNDVNFIRNGNTFMSLTSPAAVDQLLVSVPTITNAAANTIGTGADATMLTVKGDDILAAAADHFVVQGNARVTQTLSVTRLVATSIDGTPIGGGVASTGAFTTLTSNGGITISNNKELTLSGAVNNKYVSNALAAAYTLGPADYALVCTNAAAGNVNLPANPPAGRTYVIKSMGAGNVNVVPANAGVLIDGVVGNYVIAGAGKNFVTLISDGTDWLVIGK